MKKWNATNKIHCTGGKTTFECLDDLRYVRTNSPPTIGAHQCMGKNVYIQIKNLSERVDCIMHRNPWICSPPKHFHDIKPGSFTGDCTRDEKMKTVDQFTKDHLRNFVHGWSESPSVPKATMEIDADLLFVSRENNEYVNSYHATTDIVNAFNVMYMYDLKPETTQLIFFDEHGEGIFDDVWQKAFSGYGPVKSIGSFSDSEIIKARRIFIVPAGYINSFHRHYNNNCKWELSLLEAYRVYIREMLEVPEFIELERRGIQYTKIVKDPVSTITIVNRLPYHKYVNRMHVQRQWSDPERILEQIQKEFPKVQVRLVDLQELKMIEQLSLSYSTDIFIGVHGAGLTNVLYSSLRGGLIEVAPQGGEWYCFNSIATQRAIKYDRISGTQRYGQNKHAIDPKRITNVLKSTYKNILS